MPKPASSVISYAPIVRQRSVKGRFRQFKTAIVMVAFSVYFGLPWLSWSRTSGADQAVLFDLAARRFYIFDLVLQPTQLFLLFWLMVIAAALLFFVTSVAGRVFCGFFCLHTLWSDVFYWIAHRIEGEAPARIRLASSPWKWQRLFRRGLTWTAWAVLSFLTAMTFTLYWGEAASLTQAFFTAQAPSAMISTICVLTITTFVLGGFAREAVCMHMCPYSRFQSVMVNKTTQVVNYDWARGEGSAGRHKPLVDYRELSERQEKGAGDCIDCGYCVQVCPTGIDIREGVQMGCINCGLCIDACDIVMDKLGWARGLIGFSQVSAEGVTRRWSLSPQTLGYGLALLLSCTALFINLQTQDPVRGLAFQQRNPLFTELSDGSTRNSYSLKLSNQTNQSGVVELSLEGLPSASLGLGRITHIELQPFADLTLQVWVTVPNVAEESLEQTDRAKTQLFDFVLTFRAVELQTELKIPASFYNPL